jgi:hypothetical protein
MGFKLPTTKKSHSIALSYRIGPNPRLELHGPCAEGINYRKIALFLGTIHYSPEYPLS